MSGSIDMRIASDWKFSLGTPRFPPRTNNDNTEILLQVALNFHDPNSYLIKLVSMFCMNLMK
jgi:hypothetical protein